MAGKPVSEVEEILKHSFRNGKLLEKALTHSSYIEENSTGRDYERLEFLGDAVLELVTREYLIDRYPEESEGRLTRRKIRIVQKQNLASHGIRLGFDRHAFVGKSYKASAGARRTIAADLVESLIGAIYIDSGLEAAKRFIIREILTADSDTNPLPDARSRLQEYCQSKNVDLPEYRMIERNGPDHSPVFTVTVSVSGEEAGTGSGLTIKEAEEKAAEMALENIERTV